MKRSIYSEQEKQNRIKRNPKRSVLKEYEWRRNKITLKALGDTAQYLPSAKHKQYPSLYGLPPVPFQITAMQCDRDAKFTDITIAKTLLEKAFEFGIVDGRDTTKWPRYVWGIWNEIVFEAHWGNNGTYHGYPLQDDDPMQEEIKKACRGRNYK